MLAVYSSRECSLDYSLGWLVPRWVSCAAYMHTICICTSSALYLVLVYCHIHLPCQVIRQIELVGRVTHGELVNPDDAKNTPMTERTAAVK